MGSGPHCSWTPIRPSSGHLGRPSVKVADWLELSSHTAADTDDDAGIHVTGRDVLLHPPAMESRWLTVDVAVWGHHYNGIGTSLYSHTRGVIRMSLPDGGWHWWWRWNPCRWVGCTTTPTRHGKPLTHCRCSRLVWDGGWRVQDPSNLPIST
jgi:hypothetical protein